MKGMSEKLSDFGSCLSSMSSDGEDSSSNSHPSPDGTGGWELGKRKKKEKKRKASRTPPDRNSFLKKNNSEKSPLLKKLD